MPNIQVKLRRGTEAEHDTTNGGFTGAEGEVTVDTTNDTLRVHDGSTAGGIRLAKHSEVGSLSDDSVTFAKMQNINTAKVIGRTTAGSGDPEEVSILDDDTMATASATSLATSESIKAYVDSNAGIPTGTVSAFAGATAPTGYLLCDGSPVNRTTYAALASVLENPSAPGTYIYGNGNGSTTFNLPDLRGRVIAGQDDMGGTSANRLTDQSGGLNGDVLGDTGGSETHTLTSAQSGMPSHNVSVAIPAGGDYDGGSPFRLTQSPLNAGNLTVTASVAAQNASSAHNNVQPTIILNYIIKF